jgi:hypothetical protein
MAGPAMAIGIILLIILLIGLVALFLYLLYFAIIYRHKPLKATLAGILFACLLVLIACLYFRKQKADPKFLGDYKLNSLDKKKCENCKVRLKEDYTYDILVNNQVAGNGKWETETTIDIPGEFLKIENGPRWVRWEENRLIEAIDRTSNR